MRKVTTTHLAIVLASATLGACVYGGGEPPPLPKLAEDPERPALALFEHVLTGYFVGAGADGPTICAALSPTPLDAEQETALIVRFVRLAPAERCKARGGGVVDMITGEAAALAQVYDFACPEPTRCTGWAAVPGAPATRYALNFVNGAWRFTGDPRIIAE